MKSRDVSIGRGGGGVRVGTIAFPLNVELKYENIIILLLLKAKAHSDAGILRSIIEHFVAGGTLSVSVLYKSVNKGYVLDE